MRLECIDCPYSRKTTIRNYKECKEKGHMIHLMPDGCSKGHRDRSIGTYYTPMNHKNVTATGHQLKCTQYGTYVFEEIEKHNFTLCWDCICEERGKSELECFREFMDNAYIKDLAI